MISSLSPSSGSGPALVGVPVQVLLSAPVEPPSHGPHGQQELPTEPRGTQGEFLLNRNQQFPVAPTFTIVIRVGDEEESRALFIVPYLMNRDTSPPNPLVL